MYCAFSLVPPHPPLYLDEMFPLRPHDVLLSTLLRMKSNPLMQMDMKLTARSKYWISWCTVLLEMSRAGQYIIIVV